MAAVGCLMAHARPFSLRPGFRALSPRGSKTLNCRASIIRNQLVPGSPLKRPPVTDGPTLGPLRLRLARQTGIKGSVDPLHSSNRSRFCGYDTPPARASGNRSIKRAGTGRTWRFASRDERCTLDHEFIQHLARVVHEARAQCSRGYIEDNGSDSRNSIRGVIVQRCIKGAMGGMFEPVLEAAANAIIALAGWTSID